MYNKGVKPIAGNQKYFAIDILFVGWSNGLDMCSTWSIKSDMLDAC